MEFKLLSNQSLSAPSFLEWSCFCNNSKADWPQPCSIVQTKDSYK